MKEKKEKTEKYVMFCPACKWTGDKGDLMIRAKELKKSKKIQLTEHCPNCDSRNVLSVPKSFTKLKTRKPDVEKAKTITD